MSNAIRSGPMSDRTYLAAGLFASMALAIELGQFTKASRAKNQLAELGFNVTFRRRPRIVKGGR